MEHISECSVGEVRLLTHVLQALPDVEPLDYAEQTVAAIEALPTRLKRPSTISRVFKSYAKPRAPLCPLHKRVHPKIVHSIFSLIALEVGVHLNRVAKNPHLLSDIQIDRVRRLRQLHIKWLTPSQYKDTFGEKVHGDEEWQFQKNECEGCIVAQFASHPPTLLDLRAAVLSRMSRHQIKHRGEPRLKIWLDIWFDNFKDSFLRDVFIDAIEQNKQEGLALKEVRRNLTLEKRGNKGGERNSKLSTIPEDETTCVDTPPRPVSGMQEDFEDADAENDYDTVIDILDHYGELRKDLNKTLTIDNRSVSSIPSRRSQHISHRPIAESNYTANTRRNNEAVVSGTRPLPSSSSTKDGEDEPYRPIRAGWKRPRTQSSDLLPSAYYNPLRQASDSASNDSRGDYGTRKASASSEEQAQSYRDLLPEPDLMSRTDVSVWDDCSVQPSVMNMDWNRSKGMAEVIFNTEGRKHKSQQAEEWRMMPDVFKEDLAAADSRRGSRSRSVQHSRPASTGPRRTSSVKHPKAGSSPVNGSGRGSNTSSSSPARTSSRSSDSTASPRSLTPSVSSLSSQYSTPSPYSVKTKDMPGPKMKMRPDTPTVLDNKSVNTTNTRWSNVYGGDSRGDDKSDRNGGGKRRNKSER